MHPVGATPAGRTAPVLLAAFLAVNFAIGLVSFEAFKVDDSDQMLFSQSLEWGYHDHPPVYSWLCALFFRAFGLNLVAYALLKTLVLAGIALTLFWACRLALGDGRRAALAAAVTLLIPTFSWHSLTYLTHTNLLFIACAGSAAVVFRLYRDGRTLDYVLLGLFAALGVYAKYSYPLFAAALALAGLTIPGFRARLLDRRLLLSLSLATVLLAPHLAWFADNHEWVVGWLSAKTGTDDPQRSLANVGRGSLHLAQNVVVILALPIVILPLAFPQALRRVEQPRDLPGDANRLLGRFLLITTALLLGLVVVGGTTRFHERWLQPFLVFVPVYYFGRLRD